MRFNKTSACKVRDYIGEFGKGKNVDSFFQSDPVSGRQCGNIDIHNVDQDFGFCIIYSDFAAAFVETVNRVGRDHRRGDVRDFAFACHRFKLRADIPDGAVC